MSVKKKGKDAWNIPFANVGGKTYTLNHIEHEILRKDFNDPIISCWCKLRFWFFALN